ncbi:MAG: hypothetical protein K9N48_04420 [Verrucomicrobia bacterium]|nr:hypothetical protein [Verrucomicrobiota bacterium]
MWHDSLLPEQSLEKHFTEFQVAVTDAGQVIGSIGIQIIQNQGKLHSEVYLHPELEDILRPEFWERIQSIARNHGLTRIWTIESSPFWPDAGFKFALSEDLEKLPSQFGNVDANWWVFTLRNQDTSTIAIQKEFEIMMEAEKEHTRQLFKRARLFKTIAILISLLLLGGLVVLGAFLVMNQ